MTGISRRQFLKLGAAATGAAALAGETRGRAGASTGVDPTGIPAMLIDVSRCVGCGACQRACCEANGLEPSEAERDQLGPQVLTVPVRHDLENERKRWVKRQCMHCLHPACASACPVSALHQTEEGPIAYRPERCLGCRYCMVSCPFGVPTFEWDDGLTPEIRKCMFCIGRQRDGELPACAISCPSGALKFGTRGELLKEAHARIAAHPNRYVDHVYGEHEAGGTAMLYISDVPFESLGFRMDVPTRALPAYTWEVMSKIPYVAVGLAAVLGGASMLTRKRNGWHDHEPDWDAMNHTEEKPTEGES
jgi:Fe-S-cluster-containing dehydrogenase component